MSTVRIVCPFTSSLVNKTATGSAANLISATTSVIQSIPTKSSPPIQPFQSIPAAKSLPIVGTTFDLLKNGGAAQLHKYCDNRHSTLGPVFREKMGSLDCVFVADATLMQQIYSSEGQYPVHAVPEPWTIFNKQRGVQRGLFFMEGQHWSERRKSLNRVFLKKQTISEYSSVFNDVITDLLKRWTLVTQNAQSSHSHIGDNCTGKPSLEDLERELYNWSIESLGAMIFGTRLGCVSSQKVDRIHEFVHCIQQLFVESCKMAVIPAKLAYKLQLPVWKRFEKAADTALTLARGYVEENIQQLLKHDDTDQAGILQHLTIEENIEREEVVNIITDLFLAAADTTSHATQWALYLLARNKESQDKLFEEVENVLTRSGDSMVEEKHLPDLPFVKGVIKEALRLYPVAPFLSRVLDKDIVLNGYNVPAGKMIVMSLYSTGRNSQYFPRANSFEPERWTRDQDSRQLQNVLNSAACLPFGLGVRSCIGRRVAEMQMQLLLSRIVHKFKLSTTGEVGIKLRMITTPEKPIELQLETRNASS